MLQKADLKDILLSDFKGFSSVAISIYENNIKTKMMEEPVFDLINEYSAPCVVNFAFSIELGIKYLLNLENGFEKTHDLAELFKKLNEQTKQKIIDRVFQKHKSWKKEKKEEIFKKNLDIIKNDFEKWRYRFNYNSNNKNLDGTITIWKMETNIYFLYALTETLREIIPINA